MSSPLNLLRHLLRPILPRPPAAPTTAAIHYRRRLGDYEGWGLHVWGDSVEPTPWGAPLAPTGQDEYGIFWNVPLKGGAAELPFVLHNGETKDPGPNQALVFAETGQQAWLTQGRDTQYTRAADALAAMEIHLRPAPIPGPRQLVLHYRRLQEDYDGWGLYPWGPIAERIQPPATWAKPLYPTGQDSYGLYWVLDIPDGATTLQYIMHRGDEKDPGFDQWLDIQNGNDIYLIQASGKQFSDPESAEEAIHIAAVGDIFTRATAHWLERDQIAWPIGFGPAAAYHLYYDPAGSISVTKNGLSGGQSLPLTWVSGELPTELAAKFPHLRHAALLQLPPDAPVAEMLKGQIAIVAISETRAAATALQIAGVLDDLYAEAAQDSVLGVSWDENIPTLRLWAPTARSVTLGLYDSPQSVAAKAAVPMRFDPASGVWCAIGRREWQDLYYLYDVEVYVRQEGRIVHNFVTDPYSLSLAVNSTHSQIVNLNDPATQPEGWDTLAKPPLESPADMVIYELHLRDFSARDESVPAPHRGAYLAFTHPESHGMRHLRRLAAAGLTHVHLLPVFDIATLNEERAKWQDVDYTALAKLPPDSEEQQAAVRAVCTLDGFNWGYDPLHYTTPEGAYAAEPMGKTRIQEFRQMVQAINQAGLRVVMDMVYNHTYSAAQDSKSVLDRVAPGYYYRLDENGNIASSTCCANTATEHAMMEKLMLDSLKTWATAYKVDGFRFDLMGHHMLRNMLNVRGLIDSLTIEKDGVDGKAIYLYGEGWDFGEVAGNARGVNATQWNLPGSGIGAFNDRLRDAVRGGNPFRDPREQGFLTGLHTCNNEDNTWPDEFCRAKLLELADIVRVSLAGNLADYPLVNANGAWVRGRDVVYNGHGAGYAHSPAETINYISAHDNETLFDCIQYKLPFGLNPDERARVQCLGIDLLLLGQGIPFCDAGIELLRSKSLDRDSYDSGDWFNYLDYTQMTNNWGVGLPRRDVNGDKWPLMRVMLRLPTLKAGPAQISYTVRHFEELLRIRKSSRLFRLRTAQEVMQHLEFHNTGPWQIPGLVVMVLRDDSSAPLDPQYDWIVALINTRPDRIHFTLHELPDLDLSLHPIQAASGDPVVQTSRYDRASKTFEVPARTTAVYAGKKMRR